MRRTWWLLRGLKLVLFVVLAIALVSVVVMGLWNWLVPDLFGLRAIDFWQALALLVLSKILVGGLRGGFGQRMHWRARMLDRWEQMSDEQRAQFREGMRRRCEHARPTPEPGS